jgi:hypothetical protein
MSLKTLNKTGEAGGPLADHYHRRDISLQLEHTLQSGSAPYQVQLTGARINLRSDAYILLCSMNGTINRFLFLFLTT